MIYVFDMDGVLFRMDDPIPEAAPTIAALKAAGHLVHYLTNNSSKSRADYVAKLAGFGMFAEEDEIMTSAYAAGNLFQKWGETGKSVYVIGEAGLKRELTDAGMRVVEFDEANPADFVVAGWDRAFTYKKLAEAHRTIALGARFVATNRDATYPDAGNKTLPGSGALVAALATCSGVEPYVVGKPETTALDLILSAVGMTPDQCIVVGDRLDTDIACGNRAGARTVLVTTGVNSREEGESAQGDLRPDLIIGSLDCLLLL